MTDTPLDGVLLEDDFLDAARTLRENAATRARIDAEDAHAKEILAKVLTDGETGVDADGTPLVKMKPGNLVWNDEAAAANLPADVLPRVTVTEPAHTIEVPERTYVDKAKAKDVLAPALYRLCCKPNKSTVVIA
jgi:hypothetical protein